MCILICVLKNSKFDFDLTTLTIIILNKITKNKIH